MPRTEPAENAHLERLLGLYSLNKLNHYFSTTERTKDAIIRGILESSARDEIVDFSFTHHSTTKHHLHLFAHERVDVRHLPDDPLGLPMLERAAMSGTHRTWYYLVNLVYNVVLRAPLEMVTVEFPWPVAIHAEPELLQIRFTIMEPSMSSRFERSRIIKSAPELDETKLQAQILGNMNLSGVVPLDLNRGVKALWEEGLIDSPSIQWKKARSTSREVMDGEYLLKRDDPRLYQELTDKPLFAALFRWTGGDEASIDHFSVDATQGTFTFRTFSDLDTGADHVVREILERN